jgi:hypothetical protein
VPNWHGQDGAGSDQPEPTDCLPCHLLRIGSPGCVIARPWSECNAYGRLLGWDQVAAIDDGELARRTELELRAQGFTRAITDPSVIRLVVNLLGREDPHARAKRLAAAQEELAAVELRLRFEGGLTLAGKAGTDADESRMTDPRGTSDPDDE